MQGWGLSSSVTAALVLSILSPPPSLCWPNGAPSGACSSLTPGHDTNPQNSVAPYKIQVNPLDPMTFEVTIGGASSKSSPFKGFIMQAIDDDGNIIGTFQRNLEPAAKDLKCSSAFDTITHTNRDEKYDVTVRWNAPGRFSGLVRFEASVVQYKTKFWTGITSEDFQVPAAVTVGGGIEFPGGSRPGGEGGFDGVDGQPGGEGVFPGGGGERETPPPGGQGGFNPDDGGTTSGAEKATLSTRRLLILLVSLSCTRILVELN